MPLLRIAIDLRMTATELLLPWLKVAQKVTLRISVETGNDASELYKKTYSTNV
jgi:multidrug resistance efflux pump